MGAGKLALLISLLICSYMPLNQKQAYMEQCDPLRMLLLGSDLYLALDDQFSPKQ